MLQSPEPPTQVTGITTFCTIGADVLSMNALEGKYVAVIVCRPTAKVDTERIAVPFLIGTVSINVNPSEKAMLPAGTPNPWAPVVTLAVYVTASPTADGL